MTQQGIFHIFTLILLIRKCRIIIINWAHKTLSRVYSGLNRHLEKIEILSVPGGNDARNNSQNNQ